MHVLSPVLFMDLSIFIGDCETSEVFCVKVFWYSGISVKLQSDTKFDTGYYPYSYWTQCTVGIAFYCYIFSFNMFKALHMTSSVLCLTEQGL